MDGLNWNGRSKAVSVVIGPNLTDPHQRIVENGRTLLRRAAVVSAPTPLQHLVEPRKLRLDRLRRDVERHVVFGKVAVDDGRGAPDGEVDGRRRCRLYGQVRRQEGEGEGLRHEVDDEAAVGVAVCWAAEEGAAVGQVGDEHKAAGPAAGPGVAGVRVRVPEGVHALERAAPAVGIRGGYCTSDEYG